MYNPPLTRTARRPLPGEMADTPDDMQDDMQDDASDDDSRQQRDDVRCDAALQTTMGHAGDPVATFAEIRRRKDNF